MRQVDRPGVRRHVSKAALFASASALSFPALAGPLDNVPYVAVQGGALFDSGDAIADFGSDTYLFGVGALHTGGDGGSFTVEGGLPLATGFDLRGSLNAATFGDDRGAGSGGEGKTDLRYQYLDLELGYRPGVVSGANVRLFAGPRLLHASSSLDYAFDNGSGKVGSYERDADLWAAGVRAGAEAGMQLSPRFGVSLMGAGSALYGHNAVDYDYDYTVFGSSSGTDHDASGRGVYSLEGRAALSFTPGDSIELQVGYQVQQWWNLTTTFGDVAYTDTTASAGGSGDLLTHGPFARMTFKFR